MVNANALVGTDVPDCAAHSYWQPRYRGIARSRFTRACCRPEALRLRLSAGLPSEHPRRIAGFLIAEFTLNDLRNKDPVVG